jgi:hypothetical protein
MSKAGMTGFRNITWWLMNKRIHHTIAGKIASESLNQLAGKCSPQQVTLKVDEAIF